MKKISKAMEAQKKVDIRKVRLSVSTELLDRMDYSGYSEVEEIEIMLAFYFQEVVARTKLLDEVTYKINKEILDKEPTYLYTDHSLKVYTHPKYIEARYAVEHTKAVIAELYRIKFDIEADKERDEIK